jgi:hypothetical protein
MAQPDERAVIAGMKIDKMNKRLEMVDENEPGR